MTSADGNNSKSRTDHQPPATRKGKRLRIFLWTTGVLIALGAVLVALLPYAIEWAIERALAQRGVEQATIADVDFNPFAGTLTIEAFRGYPEQEQKLLAIASLSLHANWLPLWERRIRIDNLSISDTVIHVERREDGSLVVGQLEIPAALAPEGEPEEERKEQSRWQFGFGQISIEGLQVHYKDPQAQIPVIVHRLEISSMESWNPQQAGTFDLAMTIRGDSFTLQGQATPFAATPEVDAQASLEQLSLGWLQPYLARNGISVFSGKLSLDTDFSARQLEGGGFQVRVDGQTRLQSLELVRNALQIEQGDMTWRGLLTAEKGPDAQEPSLQFNGDLQVGASRAAWQDDAQQIAAGAEADLNIEGAVNSKDAAAEASLQGPITISNLKLNMPQLILAQKSLGWAGTLNLAQGTSAPLRLNGKGELKASELDLGLPESELNILQQALAVQGSFSFAGTEDESRVSLSADGSLEGLRIEDVLRRKELFGLERLEISALSMDNPQRIEAGQIAASGLRGLERSEQKPAGAREFIATVSQLTVEKALLQDLQRLEMASGEIRDLRAWLQRTADGEMEFAAWTTQGDEKKPDQKQKQKQKQEFTFALPRLEIAGENRLIFVDQSVRPEFQIEFAPFEVRADNLDSAIPEQDSTLSLNGQLGQHASLKLEGTLRPFAEKITMHLEGALQEFNLAPLTPYTRKAVGYSIQRGQLNSDIRWDVKENRLDALLDLFIAKLRLERVAAEERDELTGSLGMPLNSALDMVRNKQENIDLDIPLSGNLASPQFHMGDVFWTAFGKALKTGLVSYFGPIGVTVITGGAASLPFGALWAAEKLFDMATAVRFDPFIFEPLQANLNSTQKQRVKQMAGLLEDRPETHLVLCGTATVPDLEALRTEAAAEKAGAQQPAADRDKEAAIPPATEQEEKTLRNLARERMEAVKSALIGEGGKSGRLVTCNPEYHSEIKDSPRVEVGI